MTTEEFSNEFDVLINAFKHKAELGDQGSLADLSINEYEKSVYLTKAQDNILKAYFSKSLNPYGESFDASSKMQIDFSTLIVCKRFNISNAKKGEGFSDRGYLFTFTDDLFITDGKQQFPLFLLNEKVSTGETTPEFKIYKSYVIVPINYSEYNRIMSKAYPEPLKRQAWRLFNTNEHLVNRKLEIILRTDDKYTPLYYDIRYVRKPQPIILSDLEDTTIEGISKNTQCELDVTIHQEILQEAVRIALASNGIETNDFKAVKEAINKKK
jgi:hypothetical protein